MRLKKRKVGWIGVDVGTSTVKLAQVARTRQGWQIAASAVVPRQQQLDPVAGENNQPVSTLNELQAAKSLQDNYLGRRVAASLPMALCDVHRLDLDLSQEEHPQNILRKTIETAIQQSAAELQCDYWSAPAHGSKPAWSHALTVPRTWTDQLSEDIAKVGWSCEAIDGLPLAMARAVGMVHPRDAEGPVAALDWGSERATLCFIENQQPAYVRSLKISGLRAVSEQLAESLQVSSLEAQQLLENYGVAGKCNGEEDDVAKLVEELLADSLSALVEEIKRSCSHFQYLCRTSSPQQIYLLGGGTMIHGLDTQLSKRLDIKAQNWQLPSDREPGASQQDRVDGMFATALALSALAWEAS